MSRIPSSTYRLQLHKEFGFAEAASIADYLHELGISHVYSSPYLQAAPGSKHGYDVVDHHKVNEELGGATAHQEFSLRLGACRLGQVLDIVPNHMAISGRKNRMWWDVLENGPSSRYAPYFDIDWQPREEKLRGKLLVPILGDHYGRVLARGELALKRDGNDFSIQYFDHELPAGPRSLAGILGQAAERAGSDYLAFLSDALASLPAATATDDASLTERYRDMTVISGLLDRLFRDVPFIAETVDAVISEVNKNPDRLDAVLERQNFRLANWRTAEQDLGYRRFFDVNTLVGLRMEDPRVFSETHALILRWLREGVLDGIRIDHPDGLRDVRQYFERLRQEAPDVWIVGEKILEPGEQLRREWPIDGTTGYDYLNEVGGLFVDAKHEAAITEFYAEFTAQPTDYIAVCRDKKHRVLRDLLGSDVNRLATLFSDICEQHRDRRDYTRHDVTKAIRELVACFPIYRTYVVPERNEITEDDLRYLGEAVDAANKNRPEIDPELFQFLANVLSLQVTGALESEFVYRFQQFSGPAMAKGVEDTTFYNFNRLISLNEVGGDPGVFGISPERYHELCRARQASYPYGMLASSTHDTKRSEDVRARISVLSEIPAEWRAGVERWSALNEKYRGDDAPDRNTEFFLYQTLLGAWPIGVDRLWPYMEKACREAKSQTNWLSPNDQFEKATRSFVESILADHVFLADFEQFVQSVKPAGYANALSQALLKFTAPGVPDTYQGTELWDWSLVDPDNRRPVDYPLRRKLLKELPTLDAEKVWARLEEGVPKLWTMWHTLRVRRERAECFGESGHYKPLKVNGSKREHAIAFTRGEAVAVVATRLPQQLKGEWSDTTVSLPGGTWRNVLDARNCTGSKCRLGDLLKPLPVALLVKE